MKTISEQFKESVESIRVYDKLVPTQYLIEILTNNKLAYLSICDNEMKRLHEVIAENKEDDVHGDFEDALLHSINYWKDEREIITNHK